MAESFNNQSPYLYADNNPVRYIDYMGMNAEEKDDEKEKRNRTEQIILDYYKNLGYDVNNLEDVNKLIDQLYNQSEEVENSSWFDDAIYYTQYVPVIGSALSSGQKLEKGDYWGATADFGIALAEMFTLGYASKYAISSRLAVNQATKKGGNWVYGGFKSSKKWANQLANRGWTERQITEAITKGKRFPAVNNVNKANSATRYVHPKTGKSIVVDDVTKELLHIGKSGYKY